MKSLSAGRPVAGAWFDQPPAAVAAARQAMGLPSFSVRAVHRPPHTASCRDQTFIEILDAFRGHGGLLRGNELVDALIRKGRGDHSALARMIVASRVVCFEWNHEYWLPAFQYDTDRMAPTSEAARVITELVGVLDGWETAIWFVTPNECLRGTVPVDMIRAHPDDVVNAARIERFIARG